MPTQRSENCGIIILAAGEGTRMRSSLPKVLTPIGGEPMIAHTLYRLVEVLPKAPVAIVVGYRGEEVQAAIESNPKFKKMNLTFIHQAKRDGTGGAARCAMQSSWGEKIAKSRKPVLILPGDSPLISKELIRDMVEPLGRSVVIRMLTCELADPTGYGRVVRRGKKGSVLRIVEEKDANLREKAIQEVATSVYLFHPSFLRAGLQRIQNKNAQKEYYLPDMVGQAVRSKKKIQILRWETCEELRGVNNAWELAFAGKFINQRCIQEWALRGVRFIDPQTTWIETSVELGEEVVIAPGVILSGKTRIGKGTKIGPYSVLQDVEVGEGVEIKTGTVAERARIASGVRIGPYAHLRPDSVVGSDAKIGNFVELKKAEIGEGTSVAHLSYVGDAEVGKNVNVGCGFITCNFDGRVINGERKHKTIIEDDVFMGSDCQTVAPVRVGRGAYVASGSTITKEVPPDSLTFARAKQVSKEGYAKRLREKASKDPVGKSTNAANEKLV